MQHVRFNKTIVFAVEAYPIPMQAYLTLDLVPPVVGPLQIELYDMTGRLVISQKEVAPLGASRYQVDVRALATGRYTLRTVQGSQQLTRKVLRQ
ncbi:T9SS type A sorting domain-containing protein [Hymenobacter sp. B1770]|uniref:T9SS type A sorting domain-containing protein n=1 Tax=Hymenobacter sp. B1770 TaxID=1718788 RepID=UPI003CF2C3AA